MTKINLNKKFLIQLNRTKFNQHPSKWITRGDFVSGFLLRTKEFNLLNLINLQCIKYKWSDQVKYS